MIRRPPRSTLSSSSAASDVYKRQCRHSVHRDRRGMGPGDGALLPAIRAGADGAVPPGVDGDRGGPCASRPGGPGGPCRTGPGGVRALRHDLCGLHLSTAPRGPGDRCRRSGLAGPARIPHCSMDSQATPDTDLVDPSASSSWALGVRLADLITGRGTGVPRRAPTYPKTGPTSFHHTCMVLPSGIRTEPASVNPVDRSAGITASGWGSGPQVAAIRSVAFGPTMTMFGSPKRGSVS